MRIILLALVPAVVACSGSDGGEPPAQVAGNYTLTITDGQNGCNVQDFTTNSSQTGTMVAITQSGTSVTATAMHTSGLVLAFGAGDTISGWIDGQEASLTASSPRTQGGCAYTTTATANITFKDSAMQGTILYTNAGNGSSDCGVLQQCTSTQTFTGSR